MLTQQPCERAGLTPTVYIWTSLTSLWLKTPVLYKFCVWATSASWTLSILAATIFGAESQRPFEDVWVSDGLYIISTNVAYDFIWRNFIVQFGFCRLKPNTRFGVWHVFIRTSLISLFHVVSSEKFYSSKSDFKSVLQTDIHQIAGLDLFTGESGLNVTASILLSLTGSSWGWSLSQLPQRRRRGTPWTGR